MDGRKIESIYTDGACTGNPGPGGWGVVVYHDDGSVHELGDAAKQTTNNRMEMQAAIAALEYLQASGQSEPVTLYTDSEYLINCVTKWLRAWKARGWKKADGKPVQNQDLLEILDHLNSSQQIRWRHVRGHAGNIGNERCDAIARGFATGKLPSLRQVGDTNSHSTVVTTDWPNVANISEFAANSTIINNKTTEHISIATDTPSLRETSRSASTADTNMMETTISTNQNDYVSRETRVSQLRHLVETLRMADEIAEKGYLISSSELADLMDIHPSAVTSRGDQWRWRNWIVSRVRREGNQILWELERGDSLKEEETN
ncbi:ribonuclease HI [Calothrix sp. NIES-3974]|uniref:ribonuclease HI n=1 Tax=Calothrix sp. NIES-3974 TaxID=2005462 RepID=UPI000B5E0C9A|nr:ribonuclease HI [Calothrix sp. NIES-3974]BAZ05722.1 ribonuclease H [Calothrix sp. NIES-3974]